MINFRSASWFALIPFIIATGALAERGTQTGDDQGTGIAVVTVVPKHGGEVAPSVANQDLSIKVNGKNAKVTSFSPLNGPRNPVELVLLIDDSARTSLGIQLNEIANFVKTLPPNVKAGIAYMENGRAVFSAPLSADHEQILRELRLPIGSPGYSASPYFCLSDLAKNWPSHDTSARREVVMVTDGVDQYDRRYDPEDPYVAAAASDAVKAHLVVYAIYWMNRGRLDATRYENNAGQNLLLQVTEATGGRSFWEGLGNPVTFEPYFEDLTRRLHSQYEVGFETQLKGKPEVETFKLKLSAPGEEVDVPQQVLVVPTGAAGQ
jgi:hypothetical protein